MRLPHLDREPSTFIIGVADDPLRVGMALDGLGAKSRLPEPEQGVHARAPEGTASRSSIPSGTCEGPALCVAMYQVSPKVFHADRGRHRLVVGGYSACEPASTARWKTASTSGT